MIQGYCETGNSPMVFERLPIIVFGSFPQSRYMPCAECGASVDRAETVAHVCDDKRRLDFRVFQLRGEIGSFDAQLAAWLTTARGRFAAWIAERDRRAGETSS